MFKSFLSLDMEESEARQALLNYAQSKLLLSYKRTEPIVFSQTLEDLINGVSLAAFPSNPNRKNKLYFLFL